MKSRRTLVAVFGIIQTVVAALSVIFAFFLYFNFLDIKAWLDVGVEFSSVHLSVLLGFGVFSFMSGWFLVHEWLESR